MKMMMIQDGPMPTGADKPLRISGDPYKVQVRTQKVRRHSQCHKVMSSSPCDDIIASLSVAQSSH